jgi:hypothetical protein
MIKGISGWFLLFTVGVCCNGFPTSMKHHPPPVLYTVPGSGNTFVRQIIAHVMGVQTGSVYNDLSLAKELTGELECHDGMSAIKAHPQHFRFESLFVKTSGKCLEGGISKFTSALIVLREPSRAMWSEYHRKLTEGKQHGVKAHHASEHVEHIYKSEFSPSEFRRWVLHEAEAHLSSNEDFHKVQVIELTFDQIFSLCASSSFS